MQNIAIKGRKFAGKDTVGKYLCEEYGYVQVSFAAPLKRMLASLLADCGYSESMIARMIDGDLKEVPIVELGNKSPRYAMQTLGTEWRNMINENLWVDIAKRKIAMTNDSGWPVVLTDLRFPHEAEALREPDQGDMFDPFKIIEVVRPFSSTGIHESHASEALQEQISADAVMFNTGTISDLRQNVDEVLNFFGVY